MCGEDGWGCPPTPMPHMEGSSPLSIVGGKVGLGFYTLLTTTRHSSPGVREGRAPLIIRGDGWLWGVFPHLCHTLWVGEEERVSLLSILGGGVSTHIYTSTLIYGRSLSSASWGRGLCGYLSPTLYLCHTLPERWRKQHFSIMYGTGGMYVGWG